MNTSDNETLTPSGSSSVITSDLISENTAHHHEDDNDDEDHNDNDNENDDTETDIPPPKRPSLDPEITDVASFVWQSSSCSHTKYNLLVNHFKPMFNYPFPMSNHGRAFQYSWLTQFPWLAYSKLENGGYCLPCVLFATTSYQGSSPNVLVSRPLTASKKSLEILRNHGKKNYHKQAVLGRDEFLRVMEHRQPGIQSQIHQAMADRIASNREKLASIFKTIEFCGRQNISLRGHRDNDTDIEKDHSEQHTVNHGNFRALLHFRVDAGDTVLGDHLSRASRNATYTSSVIQNQVIDVLAEQIRQKIITNVKTAKWFTVIADEVTDISNKEQLSLVLRYVNQENLLVCEDLVGFFECDTGISGHQLADKIVKYLAEFWLGSYIYERPSI